MNISSTDLLRRLAQGSGACSGSSCSTGSAGGVDFAALLAQARAGQTESQLPVSIDSQAGVELNDDQLRRLGQAADRAEAQGLSHAVVLLDGQALTVDVGARRVTGKVDPSKPAALAGIDGVVTAPAAEASTDGADTQTEHLSRAQLLGRLAGFKPAA